MGDVTISLTDTLSRARQPLRDEPVKLYVCGVTPYDTTHLGHAFTFVQFDTLVRMLRWLGRSVNYVQNVTDIDDSILLRARTLGVDWRALGDEQTAQYQADMRTLNVTGPTHFIRATSTIPTMQRMIATLLEKGGAYTGEGGSVFFRTRSTPRYGALSRLSRDEMLRIAGHQDSADLDHSRKEDLLDFVLWKGWSGRADEPYWESPWGPGRPGWHIECSAMCHEFLGPQLSVHGGGSDLIFPHHESEIAQTEQVTGIFPFVKTWMHTGMVRMDGAKMSKSLGNMIFVRDLLRQYTSDAVRLYLLSHHYRQDVEWSPREMDVAAALAGRLAAAMHQPDQAGEARDAFAAALTDDLDTPAAIAALEQARGSSLRELAGVLGLTLDG